MLLCDTRKRQSVIDLFGRVVCETDAEKEEGVVWSVLSQAQVESFAELGYCVLPQAFTAGQAAVAANCVWRRMEQKAGIRRFDSSTWPSSYDIEEHLNEPEVLACFTDRLAAAIEDLVGPGRWRGDRRWGLWPVNFSFGTDGPDDYPATGWHIDGNWFRHTVDCPNQGLLVVGLFTDIRPYWGGTILSLRSHKRTARVLAKYPEGLTHLDLFKEVLAEPLGDFFEINGNAGDVVLGHPFLFHTRGYKRGGPPRIISNTEAGLHEPLRLQRLPGDEYSVLELSIRQALTESPREPVNPRMCRPPCARAALR